MKYFDYAATTPIDEQVYKTYEQVGTTCFYNSGCNKQAKELETKARNEILEALGLSDENHQLVFTSGGTEANNLAIMGTGRSLEKPGHFITSCFEHASAHACFKQLEAEGHTVTYIQTDDKGYVDVEAAYDAITDQTVMVSIMAVNNELGTRQPLEPLFAKIKQNYPQVITMTDYVQGLGKVSFDFKDVDLFSISSHKIYGPKATGAIVKTNAVAIKPLILGGTNEFGMRAGLQSLPAQVGFAHAVTTVMAEFSKEQSLINKAKDHFISRLSECEFIELNCVPDANVVSIFINSKLENVEVLEQMEEQGFLLSARSADSAGIKMYSRSLLAIGLSHERIDRTMRVSFSHLTNVEDTDLLFEALQQIAINNQ